MSSSSGTSLEHDAFAVSCLSFKMYSILQKYDEGKAHEALLMRAASRIFKVDLSRLFKVIQS